MSTIDRIFGEYVRAFERGTHDDPRPYLARVTAEDRPELESRIDEYLRDAPRRPLPAERQPRLEAILDNLSGSGTADPSAWPGLLPRLRANAGLNIEDVSERLAQMLNAHHSKQKIARYYDDMEQGKLSAYGVSDNVLEALGQIVGESPSVLRQSGSLERQDRAQIPDEAAPDWDEIDHMFRGRGHQG